ncbi:MAG TPA: LuxR C-terminal-related transcriptional regulator, partial [Ramlibacter sp.]|nr:LuxR C-terminal-related transcriptional regulator [Ramlibacter sp.]
AAGVHHLVPTQDEACWPGVVAELRAFLGEEQDTAPAVHLTDRQRQVLQAVAAGKTDKQIARELALSPRTVEMHVAGALKALGCATRAEAVAKATTGGLLG